MTVVNKAQFAAILGKSQRHITDLQALGMPTKSKGKRGVAVQIETADALAWYVDHQVAKAAGAGGGQLQQTRIDERQLKLQKLQQDVRRETLKNDLSEERVVPVERVAAVFLTAISSLGDTLEGIAGRISGGNAVLRQRVQNELRRAKSEFADRLEDLADHPASGGPAAPTAGSRGVEVG